MKKQDAYTFDPENLSLAFRVFCQVKSIPAHGGGITSLSWASAASPVVLATGVPKMLRESTELLTTQPIWTLKEHPFLKSLHSLKYR